MANVYFQFKQFTIRQDRCAMKVTTDACLLGSLLPNLSSGKGVSKVLDIGTGTGLLALMYAQKNFNTAIDAIEIDKEAYGQAKENTAASPWSDRITVIHADVKNFSFSKKYDLIISNPPFYENELRSGNEKKNTARHSDELSLNDLFAITKNLLADTGKFYFLFPYKRKDQIEISFKAHSLFIHEIVFARQSTDHDYFRIMIGGDMKGPNKIITKEISIRNDQQQYTEEFVELLKDYYLYL